MLCFLGLNCSLSSTQLIGFTLNLSAFLISQRTSLFSDVRRVSHTVPNVMPTNLQGLFKGKHRFRSFVWCSVQLNSFEAYD